MMTVKIITERTDGYPGTHLFLASRVEHLEQPLNDGSHPDETFEALCERNKPRFVVTGLSNPSTSQNLHYSAIFLYGEGDDIAPLLVSAPAYIYIMAEGKTIDHYRLGFID
jgi:hypothetical protein